MGTKSSKVDWEAICRDYRTNEYTQRELATKYGVTHSAIGKKARENGWTKDLSVIIKQETNARLAEALTDEKVSKLVAKGTKSIQDAIAVSSIVDVRIEVIRGQHKRLQELNKLFVSGVDATTSMFSGAVDSRESSTAIQALSNVMSTGKTLIEMERKIFQLDDAPLEDKDAGASTTVVAIDFDEVRKRLKALK